MHLENTFSSSTSIYSLLQQFEAHGTTCLFRLAGHVALMTRKINHNDREAPVTGNAPFQPPSISLPQRPSVVHGRWYTQDLPWRISSDIAAAACASGLISPLITIIDRYRSFPDPWMRPEAMSK